MGDVEHFVNFVFDGETVAVPTGTTFDGFAGHGGEAGDDVFDGSGEDVAVVGEAGCEWWSIVEGVLLDRL